MCVNCHQPCKSGGDRHKKGRCPIRGRHGEHHAAVMRRKRKARKARNNEVPTRGIPIEGIHKRSASSKEG